MIVCRKLSICINVHCGWHDHNGIYVVAPQYLCVWRFVYCTFCMHMHSCVCVNCIDIYYVVQTHTHTHTYTVTYMYRKSSAGAWQQASRSHEEHLCPQLDPPEHLPVSVDGGDHVARIRAYMIRNMVALQPLIIPFNSQISPLAPFNPLHLRSKPIVRNAVTRRRCPRRLRTCQGSSQWPMSSRTKTRWSLTQRDKETFGEVGPQRGTRVLRDRLRGRPVYAWVCRWIWGV